MRFEPCTHDFPVCAAVSVSHSIVRYDLRSGLLGGTWETGTAKKSSCEAMMALSRQVPQA